MMTSLLAFPSLSFPFLPLLFTTHMKSTFSISFVQTFFTRIVIIKSNIHEKGRFKDHQGEGSDWRKAE